MKDEIKEILSKDNIHIIECDGNWCNAYGYEKSQLKEDLLDYITNLQENARGQVNDYFKDKYADMVLKNSKLQEENESLKLIIYKTLRRIDYTNYIECNTDEKWLKYLTELKSILNDKNENTKI